MTERVPLALWQDHGKAAPDRRGRRGFGRCEPAEILQPAAGRRRRRAGRMRPRLLRAFVDGAGAWTASSTPPTGCRASAGTCHLKNRQTAATAGRRSSRRHLAATCNRLAGQAPHSPIQGRHADRPARVRIVLRCADGGRPLTIKAIDKSLSDERAMKCSNSPRDTLQHDLFLPPSLPRPMKTRPPQRLRYRRARHRVEQDRLLHRPPDRRAGRVRGAGRRAPGVGRRAQRHDRRSRRGGERPSARRCTRRKTWRRR